MSGAVADGSLEVTAHPHAEARKAVPPRDLPQQREMEPWFFLDRRYAHEARHGQAELAAAERDEGIRLARGNAGLLRLLARIDLDEAGGAAVSPFIFGLPSVHAIEVDLGTAINF